VNFPGNVESFIDVFSNIQLFFLPNMQESFLINYEQKDVPSKFKFRNKDAIYIKNSGKSMSAYFFIFALHMLLKLLGSPKINRHVKS